MLVLSRKAQESLLIGDDIEMIVVSVEGSRARLGFRAPGYRVVREEVQAEEHSGGTGGTGLLVLSRGRAQAVLIGDKIRVVVQRVNSHIVRIGIDAPADIRVLRSELNTAS